MVKMEVQWSYSFGSPIHEKLRGWAELLASTCQKRDKNFTNKASICLVLARAAIDLG